ncbi:MAG TPA: NAD-dependent epimerase/dehydratase family protein [Arcobacter sp.]|nr:NAD-dependent epimerase/dehydratase family protein [Arcobacter sp.]
MNVLIIGGNGFIGSHIVERLRDEECQITVFDRSSNQFINEFENVEYIYGDYNDFHALKNALINIDVIYHLLSTTVPKTADKDTEYDVKSNLIGSLRLLEAVKEKKIKKFIFASSGGTVYGNPQYIPIDEKHPLHPIGSYGIVKVAIEQYIQLYAKKYNFPYLIIRPSNPFGPRQNIKGSQGVVSTFMYKTLKKETLSVWGDGSTIRDYIYITDVADFFVLACLSKKTGIYNLGYGKGHTINEIIKKIFQVTGLKTDIKYMEQDTFNVKKVILNMEKTQEEIEWKPKVTLEEGLKMYYKWMHKQI